MRLKVSAGRICSNDEPLPRWLRIGTVVSMQKAAWIVVAATLAVNGLARAAEPTQFESIYAPPEVSPEDKGTNEGGVNLDVRANWLTYYVWRGIDRSESGGS